VSSRDATATRDSEHEPGEACGKNGDCCYCCYFNDLSERYSSVDMQTLSGIRNVLIKDYRLVVKSRRRLVGVSES
jgi:hypothetical protein